MSAGADVVIVGGGINGVSVAYHLAGRGIHAILLEREHLASGPTGLSSAIVRQHYSHPPTARLALESLRFFQSFEEVVGGPCGFRQTGFLMLADGETLAALQASVAVQQSVGIRTELVAAEEVRRLDPDLAAEDVAAAAYEPESGYADPHLTTTSLGQAARRLGAEIRPETEVLEVEVSSGRVRGVRTRGGERIGCSQVVLAAGPWTRGLAGRLGVELPIRPSRHPVVSFERPAGAQGLRLVLGDPRGRIYTRPEGRDLVLVGSIDPQDAEAEADPDGYERQVRFSEVEHFGRRLAERYPVAASARARGGWSGIYEVSPDWHHIIDQLPGCQGLWVVCGTSGHGFKLGPAVGALVAGMIVGQSGPGHNPFGLDRFERGQPIRGEYDQQAAILG